MCISAKPKILHGDKNRTVTVFRCDRSDYRLWRVTQRSSFFAGKIFFILVDKQLGIPI